MSYITNDWRFGYGTPFKSSSLLSCGLKMVYLPFLCCYLALHQTEQALMADEGLWDAFAKEI